MAAKTPKRRQNCADTEDQTADAQQDHRNVPDWALHQVGKIKFVEAVVEPATDAAHSLFSPRNRTAMWINIEPRLRRIRITDAKYWQRLSAFAASVVVVVG